MKDSLCTLCWLHSSNAPYSIMKEAALGSFPKRTHEEIRFLASVHDKIDTTVREVELESEDTERGDNPPSRVFF